MNPIYETPKTSLLTFHFDPEKKEFRHEIKRHTVDGKDIYLLDDFFNESERDELLFNSKEKDQSIKADLLSSGIGSKIIDKKRC